MVRRRRATLVAGLAMVLLAAGCGGDERKPVRTDVPEPAVAPPGAGNPPGQIVKVGGEPEGLALDSRTGLVAVAVRKPDGGVLVDAASGAERARVPLSGAPRHLQLAGPGGPVLAPARGTTASTGSDCREAR